jgi:hypothetical protein
MADKSDVPYGELGEIASNVALRNARATISENHCKDIIKAMQLKHRKI